MWLLVALLAALIVHGTLYPWDFSRGALEVVPVGRFIVRDAIVNVVLYVPLGASLALVLERRRILGATLFGFVLSLALETAQQLQPARYSSGIDLALNTAGAAAGAMLALALHTRVPLSPRNFLLLCTLVFAPFRFRLDAVELLSVGTLLIALFHRRLGYLLIAAVVVRGLLPGRGGEPAEFTWMPFGGALGTDWRHGMPVVLEKAAYYGTCIWALARSMPWRRAAVAIAFLLGLIEAGQTGIPGRTPEITDPLLALLLGVALSVLPDQSSK